MITGKKQKQFTRIIYYPHRDASNDQDIPTKRILQIQENPDFDTKKTSSYIYPTTGITTVKGPKTYYAKPNFIRDDVVLGNADISIGDINSHLKMGDDNYFNLNKTRIISEIQVECISNVNSDINLPTIQKRTSNSSGTPTSNSYSQTIENYTSNPGGFVGWNMHKIKPTDWESKNLSNHTFGYLKNNRESIFQKNTYYHSEKPHKITNTIILKKNEDLILYPNFDFFNTNNCSHILSTGIQAISVNKCYFEYIVNMKYIEI